MLQARGIADDRGDGTYVIRYSTAHLVPGKYLLHVDLVQSISKGRGGLAGGGGLTARYFTNGGLSGAPSVFREEIGPLMCVIAINLFMCIRHRRYDWGAGELVAGSADYVSIRWSGFGWGGYI